VSKWKWKSPKGHFLSLFLNCKKNRKKWGCFVNIPYSHYDSIYLFIATANTYQLYYMASWFVYCFPKKGNAVRTRTGWVSLCTKNPVGKLAKYSRFFRPLVHITFYWCSDKKATVIAPMHTISTSGTPMILWVKIFCINTQFKN
jgi:hypothetical protein